MDLIPAQMMALGSTILVSGAWCAILNPKKILSLEILVIQLLFLSIFIEETLVSEHIHSASSWLLILQNIEQGKAYRVVLHVRSTGSVNISVSLTGSDGLQKLASSNIM